MRFKKIIFITLVFINFNAGAEVKETLYGKSEGYPYATGLPLRVDPAHRVGALGGAGVKALFSNQPVWLPASTNPLPLPKQLTDFGFFHNPNSFMQKHAIMGLMLIKDGRIVFENYQYGTSDRSLFDGQSIPKTFTALAIGVLVDKGLLPDLNKKMADLVPALKNSPIGNATVRQTLNMQCGHKFKWADGDSSSSAGAYARVKFAKNDKGAKNLFTYFQELEPSIPGEQFAYDPHCSDALSMLVTQLTNQPLRKFFEENIWKKLRPAGAAAWLSPRLNPELTSGANSFYAPMGDYALIAQMILNGGKLHGETIISEKWIKQMHEDIVQVPQSESANFRYYGYQTWVKSGNKDSWFAGLGNLGQRFYLDPKNNSAMIIFALDFEHIPDTDRFWDWFRNTPINGL